MEGGQLLRKAIEEAGYTSLRNFAKVAEIEASNLHSSLSGIYKPSFKRMFKYANALHRPVTDVFDMFYPELMEENRKCCKEG